MRKSSSVAIMMLALVCMPALPATIAQAHATPAVTLNNAAPLAPAPPPPPPPGPQPVRGPQNPAPIAPATEAPQGVQPWQEFIEGGGPGS